MAVGAVRRIDGAETQTHLSTAQDPGVRTPARRARPATCRRAAAKPSRAPAETGSPGGMLGGRRRKPGRVRATLLAVSGASAPDGSGMSRIPPPKADRSCNLPDSPAGLGRLGVGLTRGNALEAALPTRVVAVERTFFPTQPPPEVPRGCDVRHLD